MDKKGKMSYNLIKVYVHSSVMSEEPLFARKLWADKENKL